MEGDPDAVGHGHAEDENAEMNSSYVKEEEVEQRNCTHSTAESPEDEPEPECWICRDSSSTEENPLVKGRCLCLGSIGCVHQACIDAWVLQSYHPKCSSCGTRYHIVSTGLPEGVSYPTCWSRRLSVIASLLVWPLMRLCAEGAWRVLVFWVIEGLFLGGVLFWQRFVPAAWRDSPAHDSSHVLFWDIADAFLYGCLLLYVMRTFRRSYWCWIESFGWPKPAEAVEGVDAADLELSSDSEEAFGEDEELEEAEENGADAEWVTSSSDEEDHNDDGAEAHDVEAPIPEVVPEADADAHGMVQQRYSSAWQAFHLVRKLRRMAGVHRSTVVLFHTALWEMAIAVPLSFCLGSAETAAALCAFIVVLFYSWRRKNPRKRLVNTARRYDEVWERKAEATEEEAYLWFRSYCAEMLLFSFCLPVVAGVIAHYAVSPYFLPFPPTLTAFVACLRPFRVVIYWVVGSLGAFTLMQMESLVMVPLFAPGVDLFFIRSIDLQFTIDTDYWRFILTQVFDADPLMILYDFLRMALIESCVLFLFLRVPAALIFHNANALAARLHYPPRDLASRAGVPVHFCKNSPGCGFVNHLLAHMFSLWIDRGTFVARYENRINAVLEIVVTMWALAAVMVTLSLVRIQRLQLKILKPFALFVGHHVVRMGAFLFDEERLSLVDAFLTVRDMDNLAMPMVPESEVFKRRHVALPAEQIPKRLWLRLTVFSILFFVYAATMFWLVPTAVMSLLAVRIEEPFALLATSVIATGFLLDPKGMISTVLPVCLCLPLLFFYLAFVASCQVFVLFSVSLDTWARDVIDFHYSVRQTVGAYEDNDRKRAKASEPSSHEGVLDEATNNQNEEELHESLAEREL